MVMSLVVGCSQMWALYVLLLFYSVTHKEMGHVHPMGKFLAIKSVVFFSWWQGECHAHKVT
jgi:Organic solute transporter Ostalpha